MVGLAFSAFPSVSLFEDSPQSSADPSVELFEHPSPAVFEVFKPAPHFWRQVADDGFHALSARPLGHAPDVFLELPKALFARRFLAALEVIPEEVEASGLR